MKRPAVWAFAFIILGILAGSQIYALAGDESWFYSVIFTILAVVVCVVLFCVYKYRPVFIFLLFFLLGMWRVGDSLHSEVTYYRHAQLTGVVRELDITAGGNQSIVVDTDCGLRIMVYVRVHLPWAVLGQEVTVSGALQPLARRQNPGAYDQFQHLRPQKIDAVMWAQYIELGYVQTSIMVRLRALRDRIAAVYDNVLPYREAGVMRSLVLGDRTEMDRELLLRYRSMGIFHILAISGLHVTVLMMAFSKALGVMLSERKSGIIVLCIMIVYCLMTGASVSTVRAVTMGGVMIFGKVLHRKYDMFVAVSWAGVAFVVFEPLYIFNIGFQLSFVAVFGIGLLTQPVTRLLTMLRMPRMHGFRELFAVNVAATFSTYPIFMYHFYEISLYSIVGNILIAPTSTIILVMGIVTGIAGLVWMPVAEILAGTIFYILRFYDISSAFFVRLPQAMLLTGGGSIVVAVISLLTLAAFAYAFYGHGDVFKMRLKLFFCVTVVLIVAVTLRYRPQNVYVTVLDMTYGTVIVRHRGDIAIVGNAGFRSINERNIVSRYLERHGTRFANGHILNRVDMYNFIGVDSHVVYYVNMPLGEFGETVGDMSADWRSQMHIPYFAFLTSGDMRVIGNKIVEIGTCGYVTHLIFGNMRIDIDLVNNRTFESNAHVHIAGHEIRTADGVMSTHENGAVRMRIRRGSIRFLD